MKLHLAIVLVIFILRNSQASHHVNCPTAWLKHDRNCYKAFKAKVSWLEAQSECQQTGGRLAKIASQEHNNLVGILVEKLDIQQDQAQIAMGLRTMNKGGYRWEDMSALLDTDYAPHGLVKDPNPEKRCTIYLTSDQQWYDVFCDEQTLQGFVCQMPQKEHIDPPVETRTICWE